MTDATGQEVPLIERLREVSVRSRLIRQNGRYETEYIPIGVLVHRAADKIEEQAAEIEALKVACRDAHTAEAEAMAVLTGCEERVGKRVAEIMKLRERCLEQEQKHSDALWEIGHLRAQLNAASK